MSDTPPLTATQRLADIKSRAQQLLQRMPPGWERWGVESTRTFKASAKAIQSAGTVPKARAAAQALAVWYQVPVAQIDPHGEGA